MSRSNAGVQTIPSLRQFAPIICHGRPVKVKDILWLAGPNGVESAVVVETHHSQRTIQVYMPGRGAMLKVKESGLNEKGSGYHDDGVWSYTPTQAAALYFESGHKRLTQSLKSTERQHRRSAKEMVKERRELERWQSKHDPKNIPKTAYDRQQAAAQSIINEIEKTGKAAFKARDKR